VLRISSATTTEGVFREIMEWNGASSIDSDEEKRLEKRHCCCCVRLPDGVLLVGLYGCALHAGLLAAQASAGWRGPTPPPGVVDGSTEAILAATQAAAHASGALVNLFLGEWGCYFGKRKMSRRMRI